MGAGGGIGARLKPATLRTGGEMDVKGAAAVVTGAASGLGEATARELARCGAKVAVFDRNGSMIGHAGP